MFNMPFMILKLISFLLPSDIAEIAIVYIFILGSSSFVYV